MMTTTAELSRPSQDVGVAKTASLTSEREPEGNAPFELPTPTKPIYSTSPCSGQRRVNGARRTRNSQRTATSVTTLP